MRAAADRGIFRRRPQSRQPLLGSPPAPPGPHRPNRPGHLRRHHPRRRPVPLQRRGNTFRRSIWSRSASDATRRLRGAVAAIVTSRGARCPASCPAISSRARTYAGACACPPCPSCCLLTPSPGSLDLSGLSFKSRDFQGACFADSLLHGASFKNADLQVCVGAVGSHAVRMPRPRARTPRALRATPREADDLNANSLLLLMTAMVL